MLKQTVLSLAVATSATAAMAADPAALIPAFGNTVVSTFPDGRQGKLWLSPDGAYTAQGRRGDRSTGHWTLKGDKVCLRQTAPPTLPLSFCTPVPTGGVGSTWSARSIWGDPLTVTLVAGRQ